MPEETPTPATALPDSGREVSVVIPCYNHGAFVAEAVDSALGQTLPPGEVIVVDDASPDPATAAALEALEARGDPRLRVLRLASNGGVARARNSGMREATGTYLLPLDADDRLLPDFLAKTLPLLTSDREIGAVGTRARYCGDRTGEVPIPPYAFPAILLDPLLFSVGIFRKEDWARTPGYREEMREAWEDYEFWLSLLELGLRIEQVPEPLFEYRHTGTSSRDEWMNSVDRRVALQTRIFHLHRKLYEDHIDTLFREHALAGGLKQARERLAPDRFRPTVTRPGGRSPVLPADGDLVPGAWQEAVLPLDALRGQQPEPLRVDPVEAPGTLEVRRAEWTCADGRTVVREHGDLFGLLAPSGTILALDPGAGGDPVFFSCGVDPQLLVAVPEEAGDPVRLSLSLRYTVTLFDTIDSFQRLTPAFAEGEGGLEGSIRARERFEEERRDLRLRVASEVARRRVATAGPLVRLARAAERRLARWQVRVGWGRTLPGDAREFPLAAGHLRLAPSWGLGGGDPPLLEAPAGILAVWLETGRDRTAVLPAEEDFRSFRLPLPGPLPGPGRGRLRALGPDGRIRTVGQWRPRM